MGLWAWDYHMCSFQSLCLCLRICNCHCLCICVTLPSLNSSCHELSENVWVWGRGTVRSADFNLWAKCRGWWWVVVVGGWTGQTHFMVGPGRGPTTMKIKVWDFPLILEKRRFKEGRSLNDQRSPLDQIKIELEPSQITGPQFRLGKPFSLPGGCPPIALKRIFQIFRE